MASTITASQPGSYTASTAILVAGYSVTVASTWAERTDGTAYYLTCAAAAGDALDTILYDRGTRYFGTAGHSYSGAAAGGSGGLSTDTATPGIKWIYNPGSDQFYKVIRVVNNNLIQVEALHGTGSTFSIEGVGTIGYGVKSVTMYGGASASAAVYGYAFDGANGRQVFELVDGGVVTVPVNLDVNGPIMILGTVTFTVNV